MFRRTLNVLIVSVGLLAAGLPAFACTTGMAFGDCCDPSSHQPCDKDESGQPQVTQGCLVVTLPSTSVVSAAEELRTAYVVPDMVDAPKNHRALLSPPPQLAPPEQLGTRDFFSGRFLYLTTGRLRL